LHRFGAISLALLCSISTCLQAASGFGTVLYSIGQPTDEEQLYLEFINRSRANPPPEGVRLASTTDPYVLAAYEYFIVNRTWGLPLIRSVSSSLPVIQLASQPTLLGNQIQIDFNVTNYRSGMTFQLWKASSPGGP